MLVEITRIQSWTKLWKHTSGPEEIPNILVELTEDLEAMIVEEEVTLVLVILILSTH